MKKVTPTAIFTLIIAIAMVWAIYGAKDFPWMARLYPWFVGSVGLVITVMLLVQELRGTRRKKRPGNGTGGVAMDIEADNSMTSSVRIRKAFRAFAWILSIYIAIGLLGFKIGVVVFLIAYICAEDRAPWFLVLSITAGQIFVLFLFDRFLNVFWPPGLLGQLLGDTWPWLF